MANVYTLMPQLRDFLKAAASRLDREVALGNVSYSDVDPRIPRPIGQSGIAKRISREGAHAPTPRTPEELSRTRTLNKAIFNNEHLRAARVGEQRLHPVNKLRAGFSGADMPLYAEGAENIPRYRLHNQMAPQGPATKVRGESAHMFVPDTTGQFVRGTSKGLGPSYAKALTYSHKDVLGLNRNNPDAQKLLPPRAPVDDTLNRAMLGHEMQEAQNFMDEKVTPFGSHMGISPITEENMLIRGDPEAQQHMQNWRRLSADDRLVTRKLREAGHHPDAPLPVSGRAERSVAKNIARNPAQLSPEARVQAFKMHGAGLLNNIQNNFNVTTLPQSAKDSMNRLHLLGADEMTATLPKHKQILSKLQHALKNRKSLQADYGMLAKYLKK